MFRFFHCLPTLFCVFALASQIFFSPDAAAQLWSRTNGPTERSVYALTTRNDTIYAGTAAGIYSSVDSGSSWRLLAFGKQTISAFGEDFSGKFYACPHSAGVHSSEDNGETWQPMNNGLPDGATVYALAQRNFVMLAGADTGGVYRTSDGGLNWKQTKLNSGWVYALISKPNTGDVYAGTFGGRAYYSYNSGEDWQRVDSTLIMQTEGRPVRTLLYFGDYVYAGVAGSGVYRTNDTGKTWQMMNNGIGVPDIRALAEHNGVLYAGSQYGGVYMSRDSGMTWKQTVAGMDVLKTRAFAFVGARPFAATDGGGVYICDLSIPMGVEEWNNAEIAVYPNPAPEKIYIDIQLNAPVLCRLSLYSALGERVYANAEFADGHFSASIDMLQFPAGTYYIEISDGLRRTVRGFVKN
ncbi:hypothetical protein MASR2M18_00110 [Ignavibacteria bacterium]|nr:T9SS type A sorting domain-containing protein [Bacteroidota bacterium]MCZ2131790.1 T9SS type A sorting domain-containing protein [Bacteroidota bacterium]